MEGYLRFAQMTHFSSCMMQHMRTFYKLMACVHSELCIEHDVVKSLCFYLQHEVPFICKLIFFCVGRTL